MSAETEERVLELEAVDQAQAHFLVRDNGTQCGFVTHADRAGQRQLQLGDAMLTLQCNHRAAALAKGRGGIVSMIWTSLRPDGSYTLRDGTVELAQVRNVVRWGRGSHVALTLAGGAAWTVYADGLIPRRLVLRHDGADRAEWLIQGNWRERLRMADSPLPRGIAVALGCVVHQAWGNDPYRGETENGSD